VSFRVQPDALNAYARQVMRAADDTTAIRSYPPYADAPRVGGGAFKIAKQAHDQAATTIDRTLTRIIALLEESAPELNRAAAYYRRTDVRAAASLDRFLVGGEACPTTAVELELANNPCVYTTFVDSRDVQSSLRPPRAAETPANPLVSWT
jgi:hypothetical protein